MKHVCFFILSFDWRFLIFHVTMSKFLSEDMEKAEGQIKCLDSTFMKFAFHGADIFRIFTFLDHIVGEASIVSAAERTGRSGALLGVGRASKNNNCECSRVRNYSCEQPQFLRIVRRRISYAIREAMR